MFRYAQVNMETGIVESDSYLSREGMEKEHSNLIPISYDFDITNKKWDFETETWVEYIPEPVPETSEEPTEDVTWDSMAQAISEGVNDV